MAKLFTLEGKGLKLDTASDIEPHIQHLKDSNDVEEVRFNGNTLGVEACAALAKVLETKKTLRVVLSTYSANAHRLTKITRSPTSPTSLLLAYYQKSHQHYLTSSSHS